MFARQARGEFLERGPGGAIARVPADLQLGERGRIEPVERFEHPVDIGIDHVALLDRARTVDPFARRPAPAKLLNVSAKERTALEHHLEAVVIGRIVAAGYLDAAIDICRRCFGIIEHRSSAHADPHHIHARSGQTFDEGVFEHGRADPAIVSNRHFRAPGFGQHRPETAPDCARIFCPQRFADNPADVVFAQHGGMEIVGHCGGSVGVREM